MIEGVDKHMWAWFQQLSTERRMKIELLGVTLARKYAEFDELHMYVDTIRVQVDTIRLQLSTFAVLNGIFESVIDRDVFDVIWFYLMQLSKANKAEFCMRMTEHSRKMNRVKTQHICRKWLTFMRNRVVLPSTLYCLDVR